MKKSRYRRRFRALRRVFMQAWRGLKPRYPKKRRCGRRVRGWDGDGFYIDNCIHWLMGSTGGTQLHEIWEAFRAMRFRENLPSSAFLKKEKRSAPFEKDRGNHPRFFSIAAVYPVMTKQ
jgi:hypothetical protein